MPSSDEVRLHCRDNSQCKEEFCKTAEKNAAFVSHFFRGIGVYGKKLTVFWQILN
jgi:hypothetical protein